MLERASHLKRQNLANQRQERGRIRCSLCLEVVHAASLVQGLHDHLFDGRSGLVYRPLRTTRASFTSANIFRLFIVHGPSLSAPSRVGCFGLISDCANVSQKVRRSVSLNAERSSDLERMNTHETGEEANST